MAKRLILFVLAVVCVISCIVLPVAAEFVPADYVGYPSMNAFPYPYESQSGFMANYITYPEKQVYFSGTPQGGFDQVRSAFILRDWQTGLNTTQRVTFSSDYVGIGSTAVIDGVKLRVQIVSSVGGTTYYDVSVWNGKFTFDLLPTDKVNVYLRFEANKNIPSFAFYPVLNFGDTAYPYQPYINAVLDDAFTDGEAAGRDQGFQSGVVEGLDRAEKLTSAPFTNVRVDVRFVTNAQVTDIVSGVPFDRTNDGIYFRTTVAWLYANDYGDLLENCDRVELAVYFDDAVVYQTSPLSVIGTSLVSEGVIYAFDGDGNDYTYPVSAPHGGAGEDKFAQFLISDGAPATSPLYISRLDVYVARPVDLLNEFTLYSSTGSYNVGYVNGLRDGLSENEIGAYDRGFEAGEAAGYTAGKKDGLKAAEDGDWMSLMSAVVEAPVHAFQSLFNFELFGFDMRLMISSVLTISVFILILKKIGVI